MSATLCSKRGELSGAPIALRIQLGASSETSYYLSILIALWLNVGTLRIYKTKNPKIEMKQFCSYLEVDECNQQSSRGISGPSPVPDIC